MDEILGQFREFSASNQSIKILGDQVLIKMMNRLRRDRDSVNLTECLILLLNLFYRDEPDHFNQVGNTASNLSEQEKLMFLDALKKEMRN